MKIPKILFGTGKEVHRPTGRWMAKVKKHGQWPTMNDNDFINTEEMFPKGSSVRVLFEIDPEVGAQAHFRAYAPSRYFKWTLGTQEVGAMEDKLFFDGLVESTWGLLCLLPVGGYIPTPKMDRGRNLRFFERLYEDWDILLNERHLFEHQRFGQGTGTYFWNEAYTRLFPSLAKSGVPRELIQNSALKNPDDYLVPRWIEEYIL
ncbi:MAG: hypothetical protein AAFN68_03730 [Pseudomonadota bacterium]